ncbi:acetolactate synthase [Coprinopsis cinerea AmutBmut pab1-1]|nr:acetolactate synthase [Coprinopsis cinerea AmutBmut pab1-1]
MAMASSAATKVRLQGSSQKVTASLARSKSTAASPAAWATSSSCTSSMVEAKQRVREHARYISQTTSANATAAPSVRPNPAPGFQQAPPATLPPKQHREAPLANPNPALDHSFVGLTGGQIFHEMMLRHGVKHIFGYPGGAILPVFDAIYKSPHFDFVLPRHEQGAGHMAEGYARVSGLPGVVLVTSGPGATNVITPMQDALSDGIPLIVFSGQVATAAIGSDAFQEADVVGISRSCTKWNVMVKDINELPRRINEAFKIATSGRPGPVLVDLPKDVTASILKTPLPYKATTPGVNLGLPNSFLQSSDPPVDHALVERAADLINRAQRPVIYAGNGVLSSPWALSSSQSCPRRATSL